MQERLQKIIAKAGIASRRSAEELITNHKVTVNGKVITELGVKVDPTQQRIEVNGKLVNKQEPKVYIILNKPRGYISTLKDPQKRPIVIDLIKDIKQRVFPVGRLDYHTEGLLLLTNDGDLTQKLLHPRNRVVKTYLVGINGTLTRSDVTKLESGIKLDDGLTAPAKVKFVRGKRDKSWWEITIHEGRKRQVRRMFQNLDRSIHELKRIRFGPLELGKLVPGEYRLLTEREIRGLKRWTGHQR